MADKKSRIWTNLSAAEDEKASAGWREAVDPDSGHLYYYNDVTEESTWEVPDDYVPPATATPARTRGLSVAEKIHLSRRSTSGLDNTLNPMVTSDPRASANFSSSPVTEEAHKAAPGSFVPLQVEIIGGEARTMIDDVRARSKHRCTPGRAGAALFIVLAFVAVAVGLVVGLGGTTASPAEAKLEQPFTALIRLELPASASSELSAFEYDASAKAALIDAVATAAALDSSSVMLNSTFGYKAEPSFGVGAAASALNVKTATEESFLELTGTSVVATVSPASSTTPAGRRLLANASHAYYTVRLTPHGGAFATRTELVEFVDTVEAWVASDELRVSLRSALGDAALVVPSPQRMVALLVFMLHVIGQNEDAATTAATKVVAFASSGDLEAALLRRQQGAAAAEVRLWTAEQRTASRAGAQVDDVSAADVAVFETQPGWRAPSDESECRATPWSEWSQCVSAAPPSSASTEWRKLYLAANKARLDLNSLTGWALQASGSSRMACQSLDGCPAMSHSWNPNDLNVVVEGALLNNGKNDADTIVGTCTCPDGRDYRVGSAAGGQCSTLACRGGVGGATCAPVNRTSSTDVSASQREVFCAVPTAAADGRACTADTKAPLPPGINKMPPPGYQPRRNLLSARTGRNGGIASRCLCQTTNIATVNVSSIASYKVNISAGEGGGVGSCGDLCCSTSPFDPSQVPGSECYAPGPTITGTSRRTRQIVVTSDDTAKCNGEAEAEEKPCTVYCKSDACVMGEWSAWSRCTETCGGGTRVRTRAVLSSAASRNDANCGTTTQSEMCALMPCALPPATGGGVDDDVIMSTRHSACGHLATTAKVKVVVGSNQQLRTRLVLGSELNSVAQFTSKFFGDGSAKARAYDRCRFEASQHHQGAATRPIFNQGCLFALEGTSSAQCEKACTDMYSATPGCCQCNGDCHAGSGTDELLGRRLGFMDDILKQQRKQMEQIQKQQASAAKAVRDAVAAAAANAAAALKAARKAAADIAAGTLSVNVGSSSLARGECASTQECNRKTVPCRNCRSCQDIKDHGYGDTWRFEYTATTVTAIRTDASLGWSHALKVRCVPSTQLVCEMKEKTGHLKDPVTGLAPVQGDQFTIKSAGWPAKAATAQACSDKCEETAGCHAFHYYSFHSGKPSDACYMWKKGTIGDAVTDASQTKDTSIRWTGTCFRDVVTENAPGVGGYGGSCTCPNGKVYQTGDNNDGCGSLACVGGVSGTCNSKNGPWSHRKVVCAAAAAKAAKDAAVAAAKAAADMAAAAAKAAADMAACDCSFCTDFCRTGQVRAEDSVSVNQAAFETLTMQGDASGLCMTFSDDDLASATALTSVATLVELLTPSLRPALTKVPAQVAPVTSFRSGRTLAAELRGKPIAVGVNLDAESQIVDIQLVCHSNSSTTAISVLGGQATVVFRADTLRLGGYSTTPAPTSAGTTATAAAASSVELSSSGELHLTQPGGGAGLGPLVAMASVSASNEGECSEREKAKCVPMIVVTAELDPLASEQPVTVATVARILRPSAFVGQSDKDVVEGVFGIFGWVGVWMGLDRFQFARGTRMQLIHDTASGRKGVRIVGPFESALSGSTMQLLAAVPTPSNVPDIPIINIPNIPIPPIPNLSDLFVQQGPVDMILGTRGNLLDVLETVTGISLSKMPVVSLLKNVDVGIAIVSPGAATAFAKCRDGDRGAAARDCQALDSAPRHMAMAMTSAIAPLDSMAFDGSGGIYVKGVFPLPDPTTCTSPLCGLIMKGVFGMDLSDAKPQTSDLSVSSVKSGAVIALAGKVVRPRFSEPGNEKIQMLVKAELEAGLENVQLSRGLVLSEVKFFVSYDAILPDGKSLVPKLQLWGTVGLKCSLVVEMGGGKDLLFTGRIAMMFQVFPTPGTAQCGTAELPEPCPTSKLMLTLSMAGMWNQAFGLKFLHIGNALLHASVEFAGAKVIDVKPVVGAEVWLGQLGEGQGRTYNCTFGATSPEHYRGGKQLAAGSKGTNAKQEMTTTNDGRGCKGFCDEFPGCNAFSVTKSGECTLFGIPKAPLPLLSAAGRNAVLSGTAGVTCTASAEAPPDIVKLKAYVGVSRASGGLTALHAWSETISLSKLLRALIGDHFLTKLPHPFLQMRLEPIDARGVLVTYSKKTDILLPICEDGGDPSGRACKKLVIPRGLQIAAKLVMPIYSGFELSAFANVSISLLTGIRAVLSVGPINWLDGSVKLCKSATDCTLGPTLKLAIPMVPFSASAPVGALLGWSKEIKLEMNGYLELRVTNSGPVIAKGVCDMYLNKYDDDDKLWKFYFNLEVSDLFSLGIGASMHVSVDGNNVWTVGGSLSLDMGSALSAAVDAVQDAIAFGAEGATAALVGVSDGLSSARSAMASANADLDRERQNLDRAIGALQRACKIKSCPGQCTPACGCNKKRCIGCGGCSDICVDLGWFGRGCAPNYPCLAVREGCLGINHVCTQFNIKCIEKRLKCGKDFAECAARYTACHTANTACEAVRLTLKGVQLVAQEAFDAASAVVDTTSDAFAAAQKGLDIVRAGVWAAADAADWIAEQGRSTFILHKASFERKLSLMEQTLTLELDVTVIGKRQTFSASINLGNAAKAIKDAVMDLIGM